MKKSHLLSFSPGLLVCLSAAVLGYGQQAAMNEISPDLISRHYTHS